MPLLTDSSGRPLVITTHGHSRIAGHRRRGAVRIARAIGTAFAALYTLLLVRLALEFFHADGNGGLIGFFIAVTNLLIAPAQLVAHRRTIGGQFSLDVPILVAIVGYLFLHLAIVRLVHALAERRKPT